MRAKRKQKSDNLSWRDRGDKLITNHFRGQPCAICGTTVGVCGHHLLPKSRFARFRFCLINLIALCPSHHTMGTDILPHGDNFLAIERFNRWLEANYSGKWSWCRTNEVGGSCGKIDWEELYSILVAELHEKDLTKEERTGIINVKKGR